MPVVVAVTSDAATGSDPNKAPLKLLQDFEKNQKDIIGTVAGYTLSKPAAFAATVATMSKAKYTALVAGDTSVAWSAAMSGAGTVFTVAVMSDQANAKTKGTYDLTPKMVFAGTDKAAAKGLVSSGVASADANGTYTVSGSTSSLVVNNTYYLYGCVSNGAPQYPKLSAAVTAFNNNTSFKVTEKKVEPVKPSNAKVLYSGLVAFLTIFLTIIMNF